MIDEILGGVFAEAVIGRFGNSRRAQLILRLFFGLLGGALGLTGAVHVVLEGRGTVPFRICAAAIMIFLAAFWLFNVALGHKWRWPGVLFVASFVGLFVSRILFGP